MKPIKTILIAAFILLFFSLNVNAYTVGSPPTMLPPAYSSYAPNSAAADQGVTSTAYVTLKNLVDAIGATDQATIILSHSGATAQTTYTLTTNESVPSNQMLYFENGAIIDGAGTLTLDSPGQIIASPGQQIFGSSITVSFTYGGTTYPEWWGIDGTADEVEINKAITAVPNMGHVSLQAKTYTIAASILANQAGITIDVDGNYATITSTLDLDFIIISRQYTNLRNIRVDYGGTTSTKASFRFVDDATSGPSYCKLFNCGALDTKYGFEFYSANAHGIAFNDFYSCYAYLNTSDGIYLHKAGAGYVNENHWFGGYVTATPTGYIINATTGNQNCFFGMAYHGGGAYDFAIKESGSNFWSGCRFEVNGYPIYVNNTTVNNPDFSSRLSDNYYSCKYPLWVIKDGYLRINEGRFNGLRYVDSASENLVSTTVDANSALGATTLNVAATDDLYLGDTIVIHEGGAREEWHRINDITAGVSITTTHNLRYAHTGVQADTVYKKERTYGMYSDLLHPSLHMMVNGKKVLTLDLNKKLWFGDNNDVDLYRSAANILTSSDQMTAGDGFRNKTKAGVPGDGDFTVVADGLIAIDTTNKHLYFRAGGVWKKIIPDMLLSTTTVAFNADADTTLYTVPTGYRCILSHAIVVAGADAGATTTLSIGQNGAETDFIPANTLSNLDAEYDTVIIKPIPNTTPLKNKSYAAATVIEARVANQSGGATNTVFLYGTLY